MSNTPRRRAAYVVPFALLGAVLGGCGVADGEQARPNVAASVGGTDVSTDDLDRLVDGTCDYLDTEEGAPAYPRVTVRRLYLDTLVRREAAEQLVEDLGADLPDAYDDAVRQVDDSYPDLSDDLAEVMRDGDRALIYVSYAASAIGDEVLRQETGSEPAEGDDILARGNQAITEWLAERDVDVNPSYGLTVRDGALVADDGLSVGVSDEAVAARAAADIDLAGGTAEDQAALQAAVDEAVTALPADQVCGTPAAG